MGGTPLSSDRSTRPSVGADETTGLRSAPTPTADAKRLDGGDDVTTANLLADWLARMSALASSRFFLFFFVSRSFPFFFVFFFSRRMKEGMTNRRGKRRRRRHRSHSQPHDNLRFKCVLIFSIVVTEMNKNWNRSSTSFHTHTHIKSFDPKWIQRVRKKASWFNPLMQMRRTCSSSSNSRFPSREKKTGARFDARATDGRYKRERKTFTKF